MTLKDIVEQIEECAKLLAQDSLNKDKLALIMIDAIYDMFCIQYFNADHHLLHSVKFHEYLINQYKALDFADSENEIKKLKIELKNAEYELSKFTNAKRQYKDRLNYLCIKGYILMEECESVKILHDFRNTFLHQAKKEKLYIKPLSCLYYHLLTNFFVNRKLIFEFGVSSSDYENKFIKCAGTAGQNFQKQIVELINNEYKIEFDFKRIKELLVMFLNNELERLQESIDFIYTSLEKDKALELLSNELRLMKVSKIDENYINFELVDKLYNKANKLLGIRKFDQLLKNFNDLFRNVEYLANPIHEEAVEIDQYIEYQAEIMRGK